MEVFNRLPKNKLKDVLIFTCNYFMFDMSEEHEEEIEQNQVTPLMLQDNLWSVSDLDTSVMDDNEEIISFKEALPKFLKIVKNI